MTGLRENQLGITVIEGEAPGLDTQARVVAQFLKIPFKAFPAEWRKFGNAAGPIRNGKMITEGKGEVTFSFHDRIEESSGTLDMIRQSIANNLPVYLTGRVDLERLIEIERWRDFKMSLWWVEGQRKRKNAQGKRIWIPLYSARSELEARGVLRFILNDLGNPKELAMLDKEFRDFRVAPPIAEPTKARARRRVAASASPELPQGQETVALAAGTCPRCGQTGAKKVRKGDQKRWRCLSCGKRWPRNAREAPTRPSEPSNEVPSTNGASKKSQKRTKASRA